MVKNADPRTKLLEDLSVLSEEPVKSLSDFAAYLREKEEWQETAEIMRDPELVAEIKRSRKAWEEGHKEEFVSLAELKAMLDV